MGQRGCCAGCAVLTQLVIAACVLAIIPAAYLWYNYYLKPWGEEHYDEALAAAQTAASRAASAAGDVNTAGLSCSSCLGVNTQFPISGMNTDYSTFQVLLMNDAGTVLTVTASSGVAFAGFAALGSAIMGALTAVSSVPPAKGGLFELLHMITQGQFITLLGSLNVKGAPVFFREFCGKFGWTNLHVFPFSHGLHHESSNLSRQRRLASGGNGPSLDGVGRYANTLGVDPDHLFYYTLLVLAIVCGIMALLYVAARLALHLLKKEDLFETLNNRVVWLGIQLLLLFQYSLAMTSCFQISYSLQNNRAIGGLFLAVFTLGTTCLGLAVFGVFILSRHRRELVDHGTEGHEKKPFNHRYGSFYQDFTKENRYFFVAKMALDAASGAVVGAGSDPMVQLGMLVSFNALFIILMIVRRPYLLRVFYGIGLSTSYLRIVMLLLTLVLVSPNLVKQHIRDFISQIIICINALVLLCLFARVGYVVVKGLLKWIQNRKEAQPSQNVEFEDLLAIENGIADTREQRCEPQQQHHPQTPPLDSTPPSTHSYHQTTDRFAAWRLNEEGTRTGDRRVV